MIVGRKSSSDITDLRHPWRRIQARASQSSSPSHWPEVDHALTFEHSIGAVQTPPGYGALNYASETV